MTDNSAKIRMAAELLTHNTTESLEGYFEQSKKKILFNLDFYPQVNYQPISRTEYRQFFSDSLSQESMREDLRANQVINQNRERNIIWDAEEVFKEYLFNINKGLSKVFPSLSSKLHSFETTMAKIQEAGS